MSKALVVLDEKPILNESFAFNLDENSIANEWEAVSHPHQPPEIHYPPHLQNPQQTVSTANGLVTSAVQSVASIWRVFTTGR